MSEIRKRTIAGLKVGDTFSATRTFSENDTLQFGDLTRDYNPVHYDERFYRAKGFEQPICHGLLVGGMVCEIGGQIGWLASGMNFKFCKPVYFGDTVTITLTITELDVRNRARGEAVLVNQHGTTVIEAWLTGIIPGSREQEIMERMRSEGDPTNKLFNNEEN